MGKICAILSFGCVGLFAGSAAWNVDANGKWSNEKNWLQSAGINKIYPDGITDVATFPPFLIKSPRTITVDGSYSVAALVINSDILYTLESGQLDVYNTISVTGGAEIETALNFPNAVNVMANNNFLISGNISGIGGLVKQGAGDLTISGTNTYVGNTQIQSGVLQAGGKNCFAPNSGVMMSNTTGAILNLNNYDNKIANLGGGGDAGGNVLLGSATLTVGDTTDTAYAGSIFGTGSLIKVGSGTLTLSGATNNYSGPTRITGGTLKTGRANALSPNSPLIFSDALQAMLDLDGYVNKVPNISGGGIIGGNINLGRGTLIFGDDTNTTYAGSISGMGGITKNGNGTFTLTRMHTYTGTTVVNAGTLEVLGLLASPVTVKAGATLQGNGTINADVINYGLGKPGNGGGKMRIVGNYTQGKGSTITIGLNMPVTDCLETTGVFKVENDVVLNIVLPGTYSSGDTYEIISAGGGIVGMFSQINFPDKFSVNISKNSVSIQMK